MNLKDLQIKIADVLGVSSSQKELAYETFIEKVLESLHEGLTLKVPRIGFFQLKPSDQQDSSGRTIIFSNLFEDFDRDSRNLYLTLDVTPKSKGKTELDANVFSIGVGKPLLPLADEEMPDSETSYAMLKKSIDERAKELIIESDQIPNFDLFDGYYSENNESAGEGNKIKDTLSTLTSEIKDENVKEVENPAEVPANDETPDVEIHESEEYYNAADTVSAEVNPDIADETFDKTDRENEAELPHEEINNEKPEITEPLQEISLAELLGETISGTDDNISHEVNEPDHQEEQPSLSINEFLAQDIPEAEEMPGEQSFEESPEPLEATGTVNIETFLNQEEQEPVAENLEEQFESQLSNELSEDSIIDENINTDLIAGQDVEDTGEKTEDVSELHVDKRTDEVPDENHEAEEDLVLEEDKKVDLKKDLFAELDANIEDFKTIEENESESSNLNLPVDETTGDITEDIADEEDLWLKEDETTGEKVEWNWGDELKEEFGINRFEGEEAKYEMVDDKELENKDDSISSNKLYKDLFAQLEKAIEKEKTIFEDDIKNDDWKVDKEEESQPKFPTKEERPVNKFSIKDDEKVYLEFSNPPTKYEFVAAKTPEQNKRMSIVLEEEPRRRTYSRENLPPAPSKPEKDNYFGKIFILIFSAFIVISASIYFLLRNNSQQKTSIANNAVAQKPQSEQSVVDSIIQANVRKSNVDSTRIGLDDFDNFPTTAKPPVPIKSGGSDESLTAKTGINNAVSTKTNSELTAKKESPVKSSAAEKSDDNSMYRTLTADTRVNKTIYFDGTKYNFQTSSWRNRDKAEQEAKRLRRLGFKAFIVSAYLPQKGGTWYRVRIGSFNSQNEAQDFMNKNKF